MMAPDPKKTRTAAQKAADARLAAELATSRARRAEASIEYERRTEGLFFTKDFNTFLDKLMHDPLKTYDQRVMAWIQRYSHGEYSMYAIRIDGFERTQADCVRELGIPKQKVSQVIALNKQRGYLLHIAKHPKWLYLAIDPRLVDPPKKVPSHDDFLGFVEKWKQAHTTEAEEWLKAQSAIKKVVDSDDFKAYQVAVKKDRRFRSVIAIDYRKTSKSMTNSDSTLLESTSQTNGDTKRAALTPYQESEARRHAAHAEPTNKGEKHVWDLSDALVLAFEQFIAIQRRYPKTLFGQKPVDPSNAGDVTTITMILERLGSIEYDHVYGFFIYLQCVFKGMAPGARRGKERKPGDDTGPKKLGWFLDQADDYARISHTQQRRTASGD